MSSKTPASTKRRAAALYAKHRSTNKVSRIMGCSHVTVLRYLKDLGVPREGEVRGRVEQRHQENEDVVQFPDFPDEDISAEDIIALQKKRFEMRKASHDAHTWFPITIKDNKPIGILWMGDPHVDDNGCNWPSLLEHVRLCKETDGLYGANIGDTTNCWGGRLIRKYADQDTSLKTARKLAEWFLLKSGVRWLIWLYGNHEHMGDGAHVLGEMAKRFGTQKVIMHDWEARFSLEFPNQTSLKVFAAHDHPGNSMWNPLHGQVKAARFGAHIDLVVAGHKHNWAVSQWELAEQESAPLMVRVRGYKHMDDFARRIGIVEQEEGQGILTVFNPASKTRAGRIIPFVDVHAGVEFLKFLRKQK